MHQHQCGVIRRKRTLAPDGESVGAKAGAGACTVMPFLQRIAAVLRPPRPSACALSPVVVWYGTGTVPIELRRFRPPPPPPPPPSPPLLPFRIGCVREDVAAGELCSGGQQ